MPLSYELGAFFLWFNLKEPAMLQNSISRPYFLLAFLLLGTMLMGACSQSAQEAIPTTPPQPTNTAPPEPTVSPISMIDGLDREVILPAPAQKVISLAPSNTEILFAVGAGDQVIGRDEFSDYPQEAATIPSVGGGFGDYNLEAIIDLEPDLVLAAEINTAEQVNSITDLGIPVYLLANPSTLDEMYGNLLIIAELTGHQETAKSLVKELETRVAGVDAIITTAADTPTVFYELDATDPSAPWTAGVGTFIDTLIARAAGENIAADLEGNYLQLSIEEILVRDPQVILLGDAAYGITPESIQERSGWSNLSAVINDRIYTFDDNLVSRPGPRLVDGLEQLAKLLHPELFSD
jgi:iron complex transport system substrate-binding protein